MRHYTPPMPRRIHRGTGTGAGAAIALPAAGAVTTLADNIGGGGSDYPAGVFVVPAGLTKLAFWCTYARGGAAGQCTVCVMVSNGTETARMPIDMGAAVLPGGGLARDQLLQLGYDLNPAPSSGAALAYEPLTVEVQAGWSVWLQAAEIGNTGVPGSLLVAITASP